MEDTYSQSVRPAAPAPRCRWGRRRAPLREETAWVSWVGLAPLERRARPPEAGRLHAGPPAGVPRRAPGTCAPTPPPVPPPQADALTVAAREAREALGTRVAVLPREVGAAEAAARQVRTCPVCEVRLAVAAWAGAGESGDPKPGAGPRPGQALPPRCGQGGESQAGPPRAVQGPPARADPTHGGKRGESREGGPGPGRSQAGSAHS